MESYSAYTSQTQPKHRTWIKVVVLVVVAIVALVAAFYYGFKYLMTSSTPYRMAVEKLETNADADRLLGKPLSMGFPMGSIHIQNSSGTASLSVSVTGPKGMGNLYFNAHKDMGEWHMDDEVLVMEPSQEKITIVP